VASRGRGTAMAGRNGITACGPFQPGGHRARRYPGLPQQCGVRTGQAVGSAGQPESRARVDPGWAGRRNRPDLAVPVLGAYPPGSRAGLADSVLDLPEVRAGARLEAAVPLGDAEALQRVRERTGDAVTRPAGLPRWWTRPSARDAGPDRAAGHAARQPPVMSPPARRPRR
jgi:hypothetical protein